MPPGLPATLFVVCHYPAERRSSLPMLLSDRGSLLASHAHDGEEFHPGHIYVAPPDFHMHLEKDRIRLDQGPRESFVRPAIDPLFRSAARVFGPRVIGVILSGGSADGVAGLLAIRAAGGIAIVQDPQDARMATLPEKAQTIAGRRTTAVSAAGLAGLLVRLVTEPAGPIREETLDFACHGEPLPASAQADFAKPKRGPLERGPDVQGARASWLISLAERHVAQGNKDIAGRFDEDARLADEYSDLIQRCLLKTDPETTGDESPSNDRHE